MNQLLSHFLIKLDETPTQRRRCEMEKKKAKVGTPWHLWLVGVFFVFLNACGVYDYFMMLGHDPAYYQMNKHGEAVVAYFTDYPILFNVFWAVSISSGLIASILLLVRSRWAVPGALICFVSLICLDVLTFALRDRWHVFGPWSALFDIIILLMMYVLFLYSQKMAKIGVLR
jgi:hypothetical protein